MHEYFQGEGFAYLQSPLITASDCEGAGEMFRVTTLPSDLSKLPLTADKRSIDYAQDFFGKSAFLTVSGQLSGETHAAAMGDIYTFGPTFRAENSQTTRHLAEFHMIEPEMSFCDLEVRPHARSKGWAQLPGRNLVAFVLGRLALSACPLPFMTPAVFQCCCNTRATWRRRRGSSSLR